MATVASDQMSNVLHAAGIDKNIPLHAERRGFLKSLCVGIAAGASVTGIAPALVAAAETFSPAKVVFVVFKKADLTLDQSFTEWGGDKHAALVRKIPGLRKWVQNRVTGASKEGNAGRYRRAMVRERRGDGRSHEVS